MADEQEGKKRLTKQERENIEKVKEICVKINSIENLADDVFDTAVAKLFDE